VFAFILSRGCAKLDCFLDQWVAVFSLVGFLTICGWIVGLEARAVSFVALIGVVDGLTGQGRGLRVWRTSLTGVFKRALIHKILICF